MYSSVLGLSAIAEVNAFEFVGCGVVAKTHTIDIDGRAKRGVAHLATAARVEGYAVGSRGKVLVACGLTAGKQGCDIAHIDHLRVVERCAVNDKRCGIALGTALCRNDHLVDGEVALRELYNIRYRCLPGKRTPIPLRWASASPWDRVCGH